MGLQKIGFVSYMKNKLEDSAKALEMRIAEEKDNWCLYFYMGNIFLKQGKPLAEIIPQFEKALDLNKDDQVGRAKTLQSYGVALKEFKKYNQAFEHFKEALAIDTDQKQKAITLHAYGIALKEDKQYQKAFDSFKQSLALDPDNTITLHAYAIALKENKQYQDAFDVFDLAISLVQDEKQRSIALQAYAIALKEDKQYVLAFKKFNEALAIEPNNSITLHAYAIAQKEAKQYENAFRTFEKALRIDADKKQRTITLQAYAIALKEDKQYAKAFETFERSLNIDTDERHKAITLHAYAIALKEDKQYDKAYEAFEQSLNIDSDEKHKAMTLHAYAVTLREDDKYDQAFDMFERALLIDTNDKHKAVILQTYALALKESKQYKRAFDMFHRSIELDTNDKHKAVTLQAYAIALKEKRQYKKAFEKFNESLAIDTEDKQKAITFQTYAIALKENKKYDEAGEVFNKSLAIDPDNLITLQEYAILLRQVHRNNEAEDIFARIPKERLDAPSRTEYARTMISLAFQERDRDGSKMYFKKARDILISIIPKDEVVYTEWARMEGFAGDGRKKIKILMEGLIRYPRSLFLLQELGNSYKTLMQAERAPEKRWELFEKAQYYYNRIIEAGDADYIVHNNHAKLLKLYAIGLDFSQRELKDRYYDASEAEFKKALAMEDDPLSHAELGNLLRFRRGRDKEAEEHLVRAIELDETNYNAHLDYACFLLWNGQEEESIHHYRKALTFGKQKNRKFIEKIFKRTCTKLRKDTLFTALSKYTN